MKEKVELILLNVVDVINNQLKKQDRIEKSINTPLIGENSKLDSLGVINFITITEEKIEEVFNIQISLTEDEEYMFSPNGPLRTIETLAIFISNQLKK